MEVAPFQSRTVEVASEILMANGPRRFLVADEVGLRGLVVHAIKGLEEQHLVAREAQQPARLDVVKLARPNEVEARRVE